MLNMLCKIIFKMLHFSIVTYKNISPYSKSSKFEIEELGSWIRSCSQAMPLPSPMILIDINEPTPAPATTQSIKVVLLISASILY